MKYISKNDKCKWIKNDWPLKRQEFPSIIYKYYAVYKCHIQT